MAKRWLEEAAAETACKAAAENEALRREVASLKKAVARVQRDEDLILSAVRDAISAGWAVTPPRQPRAKAQAGKAKRAETHLLLLGDTQIGKTTPTYDVERADARVMEAVERALSISEARRTHARCDELHVYLIGDMVEGEAIFASQPWEVSIGVYEQAVQAAPRIIAKAILAAARGYARVRVLAVCGNHGRVGAINLPSSPKTNWDRVCYDVTRLLVERAAPHVEWTTAETFYLVDRLPGGWGVLVTHGDTIGGGGTSGVFERAVSGWVEAVPESFSLVAIGHFHRPALWPVHGRDLVINGSTESPDSQYVRGRIKAGGYPSQTFLAFDEERGLLSYQRLYLDTRTPR